MNGSLSMYASPIDFNKNDKLDSRINEMKKQKLNLDMLTKFKKQKDDEKLIENIHDNIKQENDETLSEFYESELNDQMNKERFMKEFVESQNIESDYMISNNLDMNKIGYQPSRTQTNQMKDHEVLEKLNYIITMFEEQKSTKTNQKNEEIVCFVFRFFMIYVLDSFVKIGKYSRA